MFIRVNKTLLLNTDKIVAMAVEQDDHTYENVFAIYTTDTDKFYVEEQEFESLARKLAMGV